MDVRKISVCLVCSALVLASAPNATASDLDLRLGDALTGDAVEFRLADEPQATGAGFLEERRIFLTTDAQRVSGEFAGLGPALPSWKTWSVEQETEAPDPEPLPPPEKKPGRWLKRHWYVPVIGAAILYAVIDEGSDSIRSDVGCGCN